MILASKEISRRNNLPVHLKCELWGRDECSTRWCVEHSGRVFYADTFEDAVEYIKKRKLMGAKKLECIENIKQDLLQEVERKLKELQHIEDIRNTAGYRKATELAEIAEQLINDRKAQTIVQALKLLEIVSLQELGEVLESIDTHLDSIDAALTVK